MCSLELLLGVSAPGSVRSFGDLLRKLIGHGQVGNGALEA